MRRWQVTAMAAVVAAGILTVAVQPVGAAPVGTASVAVAPGIAGTVTAAGGGPLAGLGVQVYAAGEAPHVDGVDERGRAYTDAAGKYQVSGLAPGVYKVRFLGPAGQIGPWNPATGSWVAQWSGGASSYETAATVTVGGSGVVSGVNASLARGAVISGHVTRDNGSPGYGLYVWAFPPATPDEPIGGASVGSADENGDFSVINLPAGTVLLKASCGCRNGLAKPWFGFTDTPATAMPITVPAGAHVRGQNYSTGGPVASIAGPPRETRAVAGAGAATVSWQPPTSTGGAPITSYRVTATPGGATCTTSALSCTVARLASGVRHTFTVTATNTAGTSITSAPTNAVVPTGTPPSAVRSVTVTYPRAGTATVTWTRPASPGPVTYKVRLSAANTTVFGAEKSITATSVTYTGLRRGAAYRVQIVAVNPAGRSPAVTVVARPPR